MKFSEFALRPEILDAVEEAGYTTPTPIQERAIPLILSGRDVLGIAQTGTGKTAAFVLPMVEHLASGQAKARMPRSLIISPTRELATQTARYFETYGKNLKLNMALLIGGVGMDEQARRLERGVDVLIATPGRLLDQFERGRILLGGVTILVIDEADRMLDMGFIPDVERIVKLLIKRQQTLMFSATMPKEIRRLADKFLTNPEQVEATRPATTAEKVEDHIAVVAPRQKFKALKRLIESQEVGKAIIFCNRKREVASLRRQLERAGMNVRDIHGDLDQGQRNQALDAFKRGDIDFLVATDVAARGLDIARLPCVINYDVPTHADDYVHRVGRTGRAGEEGRAFTLALPEESRYVDAIARLTGKVIPRLEIPGMEQPSMEEEAAKGRGRRARKPKVQTGGDARAETTGAGAKDHAAAAPRGDPAPSEAPDAEAEPAAGKKPDAGPADSKSGERRRSAKDTGRKGRSSGERRRSGQDRDEPVVGMGDHTPLFMQRPVPVTPAPAQRKGDDA